MLWGYTWIYTTRELPKKIVALFSLFYAEQVYHTYGKTSIEDIGVIDVQRSNEKGYDILVKEGLFDEVRSCDAFAILELGFCWQFVILGAPIIHFVLAIM